MAKSDYIPPKDSEYLLWHDKLKTGIIAQGPNVGLTTADTTAVTADNADIHAKVTNVETTAAVAKQAVADKNTSRKNTELRARALAQRIKAHPAYTVALGALLGIEGPEDSTDLTTSKPTLAGTAKGGGSVEVVFTKSKSEGVNIYSLRSGDVAPAFLARDTTSPYVDTRPLLVAGKPEVRESRAIYVLGDAEIGNFSDEIVITATP